VLAGAAAATALRRHPSPSTRGAVAAASAVGLAAVLARRRTERIRHDARRQVLPVPPVAALPDGTAWALEGLTPLLTPPERFYTTDVTFRAPRVEPRCWRLRVTGMVDRPLELSLADLLDLGPVELDATLVCVHNPVGGPRIGTGRWYGVPVRRLLDLAGVHPDAEQLVARAVDGFTAGVPVGRIAGPADALVALGMNGRPLEVGNGFPARLLTPGLWGADANTKWLAELELTTWGAVSDFWDRRGWPRQPSSVQPGARIDLPRNRATVPAGPVTVAGVAWAPPHGVTDVEVAVGDGPWRSCELSAELAPTAWRQWRWQWDAAPGEHRLRVRTVGRAQRQREHQAPPYPIGSSGLHEVVVAVGPALPGPARELRSRALAGADDARGRARLATDGVVAWRQRGFPRTRRWPTPA
jgi:DMSO/TMAO reductase YedYZ molybdopterin-dependent catalytic subunit